MQLKGSGLHATAVLDDLNLKLVVSLDGRKRWESLALLQGSFGPFGPKVANRVRKWVPGPSRPRGPKSAKWSRKRVKIDYFSTILTLFRLFFWTFWAPGPKGPGKPIFELYLQLSARRAQMTPVAGKSFRNENVHFKIGHARVKTRI